MKKKADPQTLPHTEADFLGFSSGTYCLTSSPGAPCAH